MIQHKGSVVLFVLLGWMGCNTGPNVVAQRPTAADPSNLLDARVDSGAGRKLHIQCDGIGTPLVVFESGLGQGVEAWSHVWRPVTSFTRACVYDRANHGSSDRAPVPHSNRQMARELYALLTNARQTSPYVLVGHSMGGTNVQFVLEEHPDDVAGMVLIDASPEPPPFAQIPAAALDEFRRNIAVLEGLDIDTMLDGFRELGASKRTLGNKPLAILVAGLAPEDPNFSAEQRQEFLAARQHAQRPLLELSTDSRIILAQDSAHHIPDESPRLVIDTIEAVVTAARTGRRYTAPASRSH